jgi:hypothetical protein
MVYCGVLPAAVTKDSKLYEYAGESLCLGRECDEAGSLFSHWWLDGQDTCVSKVCAQAIGSTCGYELEIRWPLLVQSDNMYLIYSDSAGDEGAVRAYVGLPKTSRELAGNGYRVGGA